jgi:VWFA-related protein
MWKHHLSILTTSLFFAAFSPKAAPQSSPPTASDGETTIRSSVREVVVDVVVRDKRGRLVNNLNAGQMTVYDNGIPAPIRSFHFVRGTEAHPEDAKLATSPTAPTGSAVNSAIAAPQAARALNPLRAVNLVCLVLNDIDENTRQLAISSAEKVVDRELRTNTYIGIFTLDQSGMRSLTPFSNNRAQLVSAVKKAATNQLAGTAGVDLSAPTSAGLISAMTLTSPVSDVGTTSQGNTSASATTTADPALTGLATAQNPLSARGNMEFSSQVGMRELDALTSLVQQLSPLPFQKTVLLISNGLVKPPDHVDYWESLIKNSNKYGITFYALDAWGLGVCQDQPSGTCDAARSSMQNSIDMLNTSAKLSQQQQKVGLSGAQMHELMHQDDYINYGVLTANKQENLRDLAEHTGGFLIANTNNVDHLLDKLMEEVDTHYELTYTPPTESYDGHFHKIEVKLAKADLTAETRTGYFAVPDTGSGPLTAAEIAGFSALDSKPLPHAFDYSTGFYRFEGSSGSADCEIGFDIPIANLTATPEPAEHKQRVHASLLAVVKDADGQIVGRISKDVSAEVADAELTNLRGNSMSYARPVAIPPGHYTLETAVVDYEGKRESTQVIPLDVPAFKGPTMSDITMVRKLNDVNGTPDPEDPFQFDGKVVLPAVSSTLKSGSNPMVYFVVYPRSSSAAPGELRVQILKDGQIIAKRNSALPKPDATGRVRMIIGAVPDPGNYELKIAAAEPGGVVERSVKYTISR